MTRIARLVVPDLPHHVTQRGNRRERVFFDDGDYRAYLKLVAAAAREARTAIWAYCLMPNHVHFVMVPRIEDGLRATFAEAHRRYTSRINAKLGTTGHLWQGRFASVAMDGRHLMAALRYVAMNPVRAGLVSRAADWPWSSAQACVAETNDPVVDVRDVIDLTGDFETFLNEDEDLAAVSALRKSKSTGRPVGAEDWIRALEAMSGRPLARSRTGPKPRPPLPAPGDLFR